MSAHIKTWQKRAELAIDWPCFSGDQAAPYMKQEIADLRAALAQKEASAPGDLHAAFAIDIEAERTKFNRTKYGNHCFRHVMFNVWMEAKYAALAQPVAVDARLEYLYQIACVKPFIAPITTKEKWIASIDAAIDAHDVEAT